jgi:hypothetical protein
MVTDDAATIPESIKNLVSAVVGRQGQPTALLRKIVALLDPPQSRSANQVA